MAQKNIHAYVFGEHGDSSFIPWSSANIAGVAYLDEYYELMKSRGEDIDEAGQGRDVMTYVHKSGGQIIANKGATFYAHVRCRLQAVRLSCASSDSVATVSSMMHGEYGIEDVCFSTLTLVGPNGVRGQDPHAPDRRGGRQASAQAPNVLKDVIAQIDWI